VKGSIRRRAFAEGLSTAFLVAIVVGSGIMGERLSGGNVALALLANTFATGAGLVALILTFGPFSGAHMNPVVSLVEAVRGELPWRELPAYVGAQVSGAFMGVATAHSMFDAPLFSISMHGRSGVAELLSELVATFGLLMTIIACSRSRPTAVPFAVGAYISAAYWFTSSTSFANPAVTLARAASDTFTGIRPVDAAPFVVVQVVGALGALVCFRALHGGNELGPSRKHGSENQELG